MVSLSCGNCECGDYDNRGEPYRYLFPAGIASSKRAYCKQWLLRLGFHEVIEEHYSLTWFVSDERCRVRAMAYGAA